MFISDGSPPIWPSAVFQFSIAEPTNLSALKSPSPSEIRFVQSTSRPCEVYCCSVSLPHQNRSGSFFAWVSDASLSPYPPLGVSTSFTVIWSSLKPSSAFLIAAFVSGDSHVITVTSTGPSALPPSSDPLQAVAVSNPANARLVPMILFTAVLLRGFGYFCVVLPSEPRPWMK